MKTEKNKIGVLEKKIDTRKKGRERGVGYEKKRERYKCRRSGTNGKNKGMKESHGMYRLIEKYQFKIESRVRRKGGEKRSVKGKKERKIGLIKG